MRFTSAEVVVQRLFDACTARSVDALLANYAQDAHQYEFPVRLLASGHAQIRFRAKRQLADPLFQSRLVQRAVMGNVVVEHQELTATLADGPGRSEVIGIYLVDRGLIRTATFLYGAEVADGLRHTFGFAGAWVPERNAIGLDAYHAK